MSPVPASARPKIAARSTSGLDVPSTMRLSEATFPTGEWFEVAIASVAIDAYVPADELTSELGEFRLEVRAGLSNLDAKMQKVLGSKQGDRKEIAKVLAAVNAAAARDAKLLAAVEAGAVRDKQLAAAV